MSNKANRWWWKLLGLMLWLWVMLAGVVPAQDVRTLMVRSNGALAAPTNFFVANSNLLRAVVGEGAAGGGITNGDTRDLVLGGTSNYIRGILSAGDVVLSGGGGVLDWNGGEVDATLFVGGTYVGDIFHGSAANLTNIQASNIVGLVSSTGATVDAGSVPAEERLRFPIGGGLYARATVHPNALWLPTNWNGAQVWLAFTGTTNQSATAFGTDTEDPFIYASADGGNTWTLKSAAPLLSKGDSQTIAQWSSSGWQADPELYLDTNGVMRLLWMGYHPYVGSFSNVLFTSHSTNGTNWSTPIVLRKWASDAGNAWSTNAAMAGPQIVSTPQGLRLYYVDDGNYGLNPSGVGTNSIWYVSALDGSGTNWNWASATRCTLSPYLTNNSAPWHFDIAIVGSNRWYLQYGSQASSFGEYSTSTNGVNWSPPGMGLFLSAGLKQRPEEYGFYKSTWAAVPGANVPTFNAILGHTPLTQANVEGWNFSLVRGLVPDPLGLVYTGANTNGLLLGGNALYGGVGRLGGLTVVDNFHGSSSGKVVLGQPFNGWGGIAIGYNSPMASTNYVLASDGLTETRLNARGSGSVNIAVNNAVKATVTSSNASFVVPLYANGAGVSNVMAETLVNAANVTNLSVWGSGVAEGTRLWFMDEQLAYAGGSWYFTGGVDFSGAEVEGLVGITSTGSSTPLAARGASGQTANLFEVQDAGSNVLVSVSPSGTLSVSNITASGIITGDGSGLTNSFPAILATKTRLVFEGDSMTAGTATGGISYDYYLTNLWSRYASQLLQKVNVGASSDTVSNMNATYVPQIRPHAPTPGTNAILFIWGGFNDLQFTTNSGDAIFGYISNLCAQAKADGFTTVVLNTTRATTTSACTSSACVARRERLNLLLRLFPIADYSVDANYLLSDIQNDLVDGIHPTTNSHAMLAAEIDRTLTGVPNYGYQQSLPGIAGYVGSKPLTIYARESTNHAILTLSTIENYNITPGSGNQAGILWNSPAGVLGTLGVTYDASTSSSDMVFGSLFSSGYKTAWTAPSVIIKGSGRMGIATTNPATTLDVNGHVTTRSNLLVAGNAFVTNTVTASNVVATAAVTASNFVASGTLTASNLVASAGGRGGLTINAVTNVQDFGAAYTTITNWTTAKTGARIGLSTGAGTMTITNAGTYWIHFQAACAGAGTAAVEVALHQSGAEDTTLETSRTFSRSRGSLSFGGHLTTTTNNAVIDVRVKVLSGTETISFFAAQFSAHRILD